MGDYPNSEDEFEVMYGDELAALRELDENEELANHIPGPPSRRSLNFTAPSQQPGPSTSQEAENSFEADFQKLDESFNEKKRRVEDVNFDLEGSLYPPKKRKTEQEKYQQDLELISLISQMREQSCSGDPMYRKKKDVTFNRDFIKRNISRDVPNYPFMPLTNHNGERIYIRMHSEDYETEEINRIKVQGCCKNLLGAKVWDKVNAILNKPKREILPFVERPESSQLWVEQYRPTKYTDLLSEESLNRALLKWLQLWDKVVFRKFKKSVKKTTYRDRMTKAEQEYLQDLDSTLDEHDRPKYKVALLCGPPGLGKTTLAHVVAQQCGYNVVEMNASDDRNVESFKQALEAATQMRSVLDKDRKPNCLIFDEIDGAPAPSIDFLINFIQGNTKTRKGKKQKFVLKRPIICICNDVYTPALRPLRQISFILSFSPSNLLEFDRRLTMIAKDQNIQLDAGIISNLAQKTNYDIRSCLSAISFFKDRNVLITLDELEKMDIGLKDKQKGLFNVWADVLKSKKRLTVKERASYILESVQLYGDYDRLIDGIFENYPVVKRANTSLKPLCRGLEWFSFTDCLLKKIQETQSFFLSGFFPYAFVAWHFMFCGTMRETIKYPKFGYEIATKLYSVNSTISFILDHMTPSQRCFTTRMSLILDTIPYLTFILVPNLRTLNLTLYAPDEKERIARAVDIMIDYSTTFVQERNANGYEFRMEPDLDDIGAFQSLSNKRRVLSYTSRQMIAREIEVEKLRREQVLYKEAKQEIIKNSAKKDIPNHLQKLEARKPKEAVPKDFFGRPIPRPEPVVATQNGQSKQTLSTLWYDFKEGLSRAVRRPMMFDDLIDSD